MAGQYNIMPSVFYTGSSAGAEAIFSRYTLIGYWDTSLGASHHSYATNSAQRLEDLHITACADYMFRLVGTRSRSVSLYLGGGAFLGYEAIDPLRRLPAQYQSNLDKGYFIYGLRAKLAAEFFVVEKIAICVEAATPVNFRSPLGWFNYNAGLGLKFLL